MILSGSMSEFHTIVDASAAGSVSALTLEVAAVSIGFAKPFTTCPHLVSTQARRPHQDRNEGLFDCQYKS